VKTPRVKDPETFFSSIFKKATKTERSHDPTVMALASNDVNGIVTVRYVLFKGFKNGKLCFASNYESRKGLGFEKYPNVAASFYWHNMYTQVRIEGIVEKFNDVESDALWNSRPLESQVSAFLSYQSQPLRKTFKELKLAHKEQLHHLKQLQVKALPRPDFWGGYWIVPTRFEFWFGQANRLHERISYIRNTKNKSKRWTIENLYP
jgi:pyridoxamine 5'-phosphate oxidase